MVILHKKIAGVSAAGLDRFVGRARRTMGLRRTVNVLVTSSTAVRSLNREFRGKNKATDVLSFPAAPTAGPSRVSGLAGEIAISADIALQNSLRYGHSAAQEIKILMLHGILHLAGFDHERDNGEMARKETNLRRALRLPAALIERTGRGRAAKQKKMKQRGRTAGAAASRRTA